MTRKIVTTRHGASLLALACVIALVPAGWAQARLGDLDPSFDGDGIALPDVGAAQLHGLAVRPDGRPVAAGWTVGTPDDVLVLQRTTAGAPDGTFGVAGVAQLSPDEIPRRAYAVAIDPLGRVLVAGRRAFSATAQQPLLLRLSPTGGLDTGFADAFGQLQTTGEAFAVAPHQGGVVVAGYRITPGGTDSAFVARLLDSGAQDTPFGFRVPFPGAGRALALAVMSDGRIVVAGRANVNGVQRPALARLLPTGAPDPTFGLRGFVSIDTVVGELRAVAVDGAGNITAAGEAAGRALVVKRGAVGVETLHDGAALNAVMLDGARSLVAGRDGASRLLLSSLDAGGAAEPALAWRSFPGAGEAFGIAPGPGGTIYTAGSTFVSRHLPNAAPAAALSGPAQVVAGAPAAFDAGGSGDPEGEPLRFVFDLDGDGAYEFDGGGNPLALRSFPAPGNYRVGVRVTDPRGASAAATHAFTVVAPGQPVPQPVLGQQGVARPMSGTVRLRLPGTRRFVLLTDLAAIPNGTEIDARKGRVFISVLRNGTGRLDGAAFYKGRFVFRQGEGARPITRLKLSGGSFANCTVRARTSSLAMIASVKGGTGTRKKRRVRRLWGDGRGRFRTRGRYGAATVRGTKWLTLDRCDGTKVRVVNGKVAVKRLARPNRPPRILRAGQSTLVPFGR
jgi:uncharacterized delta-60 repeat protein